MAAQQTMCWQLAMRCVSCSMLRQGTVPTVVLLSFLFPASQQCFVVSGVSALFLSPCRGVMQGGDVVPPPCVGQRRAYLLAFE